MIQIFYGSRLWELNHLSVQPGTDRSHLRVSAGDTLQVLFSWSVLYYSYSYLTILLGYSNTIHSMKLQTSQWRQNCPALQPQAWKPIYLLPVFVYISSHPLWTDFIVQLRAWGDAELTEHLQGRQKIPLFFSQNVVCKGWWEGSQHALSCWWWVSLCPQMAHGLRCGVVEMDKTITLSCVWYSQYTGKGNSSSFSRNRGEGSSISQGTNTSLESYGRMLCELTLALVIHCYKVG